MYTKHSANQRITVINMMHMSIDSNENHYTRLHIMIIIVIVIMSERRRMAIIVVICAIRRRVCVAKKVPNTEPIGPQMEPSNSIFYDFIKKS